MSSQTPNINPVNNVVDIDLSIGRTPVRFGKDDSRMVYIDTNDLNLIKRMNDVYPKLQELSMKVTSLKDVDENNIMASMSETLTSIDKEMRDMVDFIFDAEVSKAALPAGNMYNIYNGDWAYNIIISALLGQFAETYQKEFAKMKKKIEGNRAVSKYVKKKR